MYQSRNLADENVGVWHFHGDCNTRLEKSPRGVNLWWASFAPAYRNNLGGVRDWVGAIGNSFLDGLIKTHQAEL
jgi:hypothetical protein